MSTAQKWVVGAMIAVAAASAIGVFQMSADTRNMANLTENCVRVEQTIKKNEMPGFGEGKFEISSKFLCPSKEHSGGWKLVGASATTDKLDGELMELSNFKNGMLHINSKADAEAMAQIREGNLDLGGNLVNFRKSMQEIKAEQKLMANGERPAVYTAKR